MYTKQAEQNVTYFSFNFISFDFNLLQIMLQSVIHYIKETPEKYILLRILYEFFVMIHCVKKNVRGGIVLIESRVYVGLI
jgi:hypothetical protein